MHIRKRDNTMDILDIWQKRQIKKILVSFSSTLILIVFEKTHSSCMSLQSSNQTMFIQGVPQKAPFSNSNLRVISSN